MISFAQYLNKLPTGDFTMKTFCKQVKYYERLEIVLPTDVTSGWEVKIELEDGTSFVFSSGELDLVNDFIVVPEGIVDPTFEDYPNIEVDWSKINVNWSNPYTMLAIWQSGQDDEKPKSLKIICCEKAYDNFCEEIWPSSEDISDQDYM